MRRQAHLTHVTTRQTTRQPAQTQAQATGRARIRWLAPFGLGLAQGIAAAGLVFVALAAPHYQQGFRGIANDTASSGSLRRIALFRTADGWIPGLSTDLRPVLSPTVYLWSLRAALIVLALLQLAALLTVLCQGEPAVSPLVWLAGPLLAAVVLLAYPPLSSDVFYYAISGHVANAGANPYLHAPNSFPNDPFLIFNDWRGITSPYGPLWTSISRGVVWITGADPVRAVVGFKIVAAAAALGSAGIVYKLAQWLGADTRRALGAMIIVAWQPALLLESAGTAHNDAVMVLVALAGLLLIASQRQGGTRGGLLLIGAAAAIKYVMLPMLGFALLWRLADRHIAWRKLIRRWLLDGIALGVLTVVVFAPYWAGTQTVHSMITEPARLFVNPLWLLPRLLVIRYWGKETGVHFRDTTEKAAFWLAIAILILTVLWLIVRSFQLRRHWPVLAVVRRQRTRLRLQAQSWAVGAVALALLPVNAHAWYALWAFGPVALAWAAAMHSRRFRRRLSNQDDEAAGDSSRLAWWLFLYLAWTAISFIVYHTRAPGPHGLL